MHFDGHLIWLSKSLDDKAYKIIKEIFSERKSISIILKSNDGKCIIHEAEKLII